MRAREHRYYGRAALALAAPEAIYYPPVSYGRRWQREAKRHLAEHPFCVECDARGETVVATQCDHVVPHRGDARLFWDLANRQSLCDSCHSRKTAREVGLGHVR